MNNKIYSKAQIMAFYVVAYGNDCDGCSHFCCKIFSLRQDAKEYAVYSSEYSDGTQYAIVDIKEAVEYCDSFNCDLPDFE